MERAAAVVPGAHGGPRSAGQGRCDPGCAFTRGRQDGKRPAIRL